MFQPQSDQNWAYSVALQSHPGAKIREIYGGKVGYQISKTVQLLGALHPKPPLVNLGKGNGILTR